MRARHVNLGEAALGEGINHKDSKTRRPTRDTTQLLSSGSSFHVSKAACWVRSV